MVEVPVELGSQRLTGSAEQPALYNPNPAKLSGLLEAAGSTADRVAQWTSRNAGRLAMAGVAAFGLSHAIETAPPAEAQTGSVSMAKDCSGVSQQTGEGQWAVITTNATPHRVNLMFKLTTPDGKTQEDPTSFNPNSTVRAPTYLWPYNANPKPEDATVELTVKSATDTNYNPVTYSQDPIYLTLDCLPNGTTTTTGNTTTTAPAAVTTTPTTIARVTTVVPATTAPKPATTTTLAAVVAPANTSTIPTPTTAETLPPTTAAVTPTSAVSKVEAKPVASGRREGIFVVNEGHKDRDKNRGWGVAAILAGTIAVAGAARSVLLRKSRAIEAKTDGNPITTRHRHA